MLYTYCFIRKRCIKKSAIKSTFNNWIWLFILNQLLSSFEIMFHLFKLTCYHIKFWCECWLVQRKSMAGLLPTNTWVPDQTVLHWLEFAKPICVANPLATCLLLIHKIFQTIAVKKKTAHKYTFFLHTKILNFYLKKFN